MAESKKQARRPHRKPTQEQRLAAEECRLERELKAAQAKRLEQRKQIERSFIFGKTKPLRYHGGPHARQLIGPARRAYDVISTYYVSALRTDHEAALELAVENAMMIVGRLPVTIKTDGPLLYREVTPASFQLGLSFLEAGLKWLADRDKKAAATSAVA